MSVLLETSYGDIVIDLFTDEYPLTTFNFLKLSKNKYYSNCILGSVYDKSKLEVCNPEKANIRGSSIFGICYGQKNHLFRERKKSRERDEKVLIASPNSSNGSWFVLYPTKLNKKFDDEYYLFFGKVSEGILPRDNFYDSVTELRRQFVWIKHTRVLFDPFPDMLEIENKVSFLSPTLVYPHLKNHNSCASSMDCEEIDEDERRTKVKSKSTMLEILGDIPHADTKPPDNVLFICNLNQITNVKDLNLIFSRYGKVMSCNIIKDRKTNESLHYGFVEFSDVMACERAYFKMNSRIIDDRRIKVDFSQSVARLKNQLWRKEKCYRTNR
jgi:peptidyl-prolyl cis-trans isomerase-like 4